MEGSMARAPKAGRHYDDAEVALVYLVEKSPEADELLAQLLGRTSDAINMMRRWRDRADFPPGAYNRIKRQFEWAEDRLGPKNLGKIKVEGA
jgi:hypothetical protein